MYDLTYQEEINLAKTYEFTPGEEYDTSDGIRSMSFVSNKDEDVEVIRGKLNGDVVFNVFAETENGRELLHSCDNIENAFVKSNRMISYKKA